MGLYSPGCGVFGRYPPPAIWAGTKAQIEKYAVPTVREGWRTFFAITEPSGGSDPAGAIQTRAERRGDTWVLNGRKVFISSAHNGKWGVVFARTNKEKGPRRHLVLHPGARHARLHRQAHPHDPHRGHSQRRRVRGLRAAGRRR